jgi:hypothetical protein
MFRTKKDVDRHVQDVMRKLKSESEVSSAIPEFRTRFEFETEVRKNLSLGKIISSVYFSVWGVVYAKYALHR